VSPTNPATHQEAAFLVIEGIIERLFRESGNPVSHDAIAETYLKDSVGRQILVDRQHRLSKGHTLEWLAANDVAWFGARMSAGTLASSGRYIRSRVNGKWAYALA
jgi:hypothetical protein